MDRDSITEEYANKIRELEDSFRAEKDKLEQEYKDELLKVNVQKDIDSTLDISIAPLRYTLRKKGFTMKSFCTEYGFNYQAFSNTSQGRAMFKSDRIAEIAAKLQVPVSEVVEFNGFVPKPTLAKRYGYLEDFVIPDNPEGVVTYKPLFDLIKSFYFDKDEKKTVSDLFDKIENKKDGRSNNKGNIEGIRKALEARGIDINNPKHTRENMTGLSCRIRTKINHDQPVNMRVIYEICKLLQCNVDFVMGWK